MKHIFKCPSCHTYTLKESCPKCHSKTESPKPPKFSSQDKYGQYRREQKKPSLKQRNLY